MIRVSGLCPSAAAVRLWRLAALTAAGTMATIGQADAAVDFFYGQFYGQQPYYYYRQEAPVPARPRPARRPTAVKKEVPEKETGAKPQGPLVISISIDRQQLKIYDSNGFFAETPISTGMRGHPTPMGVFSVIQKQKYHRSNIYSGAPMPYMQRITWSGIAMHAGVLPGYPASHGCIRMPMPFAIRMYNWTRMGARVLVTPGELSPESFSHPLLASFKMPQPTAAAEPQADAPLAIKADKGAGENRTASSDDVVGLKPSVGHDGESPAPTDDAATASLRAQTKTADASGDTQPAKDTVMISDATAATALPREQPAHGDVVSQPGNDVAATKAESPTAIPAAKPDDKPAAPAAASDAAGKPPVAAKAADDNKDQSRLSDSNKPAPAKPEAAKRAGQIAVFISRKDSKLYVRQNFAPLFDVPVTIAPGDRPLGTHVFTVTIDKNDGNALRWTVVSLPATARIAQREDEERSSRRRRFAGAIAAEAKPLPVPDSPAEALDRVAIPADTMARIAELLTTGASIIVADQGINQGETGEGTDFIVRLR